MNIYTSDYRKSEYQEYKHFTDYRIFDADQHLYEGDDCYTRHIESKYKDRTFRIEYRDGKPFMIADGKVKQGEHQPGKVPHPGSLKEMLKSVKKGEGDMSTYEWMYPDPAFSDPALRLKQLDEQNIEGCILYSNGPGLMAENMIDDHDLYYASSWAYLRWLQEEYGFSRDNRLFVSPIFSMRDVNRTCEQLDYYLDNGGKVVGFVAWARLGALAWRSAFRPHLGPHR